MDGYRADIPVVIVGGGPCGLTAANLLAVYGVDCVVLEQDAAPLDLPRAIVLDDEGLRTLQVFGLDKTYLRDTAEGDGARYYDDDGVCFAQTGKGPRNFGFAKRQFFFQPELEAVLRDRLEGHAPGTLRFSSRVIDIAQAPDHAVVTVRDAAGALHRIRTQWVLACDGGRSPIRERLGIAMSGATYEQDWIVIDTVNDPDGDLFSKFHCSAARPHVSIPAPHGGRRYEFMLLPGETREAMLADDVLAGLMAPFRVYDPAEVVRKTVYTFHARIAERFQDGRILLMGDAAHLTPPFAGQGMNAGLRDAHNVAWKVAAAVKGWADDAVLGSYDLERRGPAWDMIQLAVAMGAIVMPAEREQLMFRNLLLAALKPFPKVRDYLIQMKFKPKPRYGAGLFLDLDTPDFDASLVGEMIPQPRLQHGADAPLLDDVLGPGFSLIAQNEAGRAALAGLGRNTLLGLPLTGVVIDTMNRGTGVPPLERDVARPLLTHRDQILLIRPDRYCAATFFPEALEDALARYEDLLRAPPTARNVA
jgi:3-(3-hydroxy-phenyl)propionate hydroxylase